MVGNPSPLPRGAARRLATVIGAAGGLLAVAPPTVVLAAAIATAIWWCAWLERHDPHESDTRIRETSAG